MTIIQEPGTPTSSSCFHSPPCPPVEASDRDAAHVLVSHPEQGWSLLCNGIVLFEDFGELLPDGKSFGARRRELLMASPHRVAS
ncbi:MAG TPA: DUF5999 family protein [Jatrophihabitantaceae bacterium]|jgi:hypothetical protein